MCRHAVDVGGCDDVRVDIAGGVGLDNGKVHAAVERVIGDGLEHLDIGVVVHLVTPELATSIV